MKRILIIILSTLCAFLCSCSSNEATYDVSENVKKAGVKTIGIVDKYLDYEIDGENAQKQLKKIYNRCPEKTNDDFHVKFTIDQFIDCINEIDNPEEDSYSSVLKDEDNSTIKTRKLLIALNVTI